MTGAAGIVAAASRFPLREAAVRDPRLGIESVRACDGETGSELAAAAASAAIERAGIAAGDLDVLVDYSVLPQEYLVPAWSMSNKLQSVLGAKKAFTVGFSGAGSTGFVLALHFAASLIASDPSVGSALLLGADVALPDDRVLNPDDPVSILGDGASAVVVRRGSERGVILGARIVSDGEMHDVCYIPGGAMAHPDRADLYRMQLDRMRYDRAERIPRLRELAAALLEEQGLRFADVRYFVYPNLSRVDQEEFAAAFDAGEDRMCRGNLPRFGHVQGTDLVLNWAWATEHAGLEAGAPVLICSHGMGFLEGAALLRN